MSFCQRLALNSLASERAKAQIFAVGEDAGGGDDAKMSNYLNVDIPFDGLGLVDFPATDAISPVFTLWVTLILMYLSAPQPPVLSDISIQALRNKQFYHLQ